MNHLLLDMGLGGLVGFILIAGFVFVWIVEFVVMLLLKFNPAGKCLLDSFIVNLASLGAGYLLSSVSVDITMGGDNFADLLLSFSVTVIIESLLLQVLNRKKR